MRNLTRSFLSAERRRHLSGALSVLCLGSAALLLSTAHAQPGQFLEVGTSKFAGYSAPVKAVPLPPGSANTKDIEKPQEEAARAKVEKKKAAKVAKKRVVGKVAKKARTRTVTLAKPLRKVTTKATIKATTKATIKATTNATTNATIKAKAASARTVATKQQSKKPLTSGSGSVAAMRTAKPAPIRTAKVAVAAPALEVDAGTLGSASGTAGSTQLVVESNALSPWVSVPSLALILGGFALWTRRRQTPVAEDLPVLRDPVLHLDPGDVATSSARLKADLLQRVEPFYRDLRMASVRKDHDFILQHCTEDLATSLILDCETEVTPGAQQVDGLQVELVDLFEEVNRYVASVQYTANVQLGSTQPRKVQELWHFVREPSADAWRLAAVEST